MQEELRKEQVKELWRRCFHDDEAFIELYFQRRYSQQVSMTLEEDEKVVAALQMLPYPMTLWNHIVETAYISGACTHPDFRNRGWMGRLLTHSFRQMRNRGTMVSTLIPAEPWLFGFYERNGYATVAGLSEEFYRRQPSASPAQVLPVMQDDALTPAQYRYLDHRLHERSCCLLHTEEDMQTVWADMRLSGGKVCTWMEEGEIRAMGFVYPTDDRQWRVEEVVADNPQDEERLLQGICQQMRCDMLRVKKRPSPGQGGKPLGMMRIVHADTFLCLYARTHPDAELHLQVTDEQIEENCGTYHIHGGKCYHASCHDGTCCRPTDISQLTCELLLPETPCMSLMMD